MSGSEIVTRSSVLLNTLGDMITGIENTTKMFGSGIVQQGGSMKYLNKNGQCFLELGVNLMSLIRTRAHLRRPRVWPATEGGCTA